MATSDDLVRVQQAHHLRFVGMQEATGDLVGEAWDAYAGLDDISAARFTGAAASIVDAAKAQTSTLAVAYMSANDAIVGAPPAGLVPTVPTIRGGTPTVDVYHRSIVEARALVSHGAAPADALAAGRSRAMATARTDVSLANRAEMDRGGALRPWVVGYRRVLTGRSCAFCARASTQRYRSADLMPIHPNCDCDVAEILGTEDPGHVINEDLLKAINEEGAVDARYVVDEDGSILTPKGDPVRIAVKPHGELGETITRGSSAPLDDIGPAKKPRSRATINDPDVLREAQRRNVSPERVVELRNEKAERRFLEDRARREATKNLSADSPDVIAAARRAGVDPDEVLAARARVADVRKVAREEAARVQRAAMDELLDRGTVTLKTPPRAGAKTGMGTAARRGEWDWLERLDPRERSRLSRQWFGGNQAPDQMALDMSNALRRDLSVDDAVEAWLDLNRRAEAAGALRRGKLPSSRAYSDAVDIDRLLPQLADEGYDATELFGDDLGAAAHIARVEKDLVADEALNFLGNAAAPIEGPAPFRMSYQSWHDEVRQIEYDIREGLATATDRARHAELVPQFIDEPGLDFEDLYARIVSTARLAGQEVPDYARIPW